MAPRHQKTKQKIHPQLPTLHPHAAGIDIGAREIWVAVPPGSDPKPVRSFDTFTDELLKLRDWLLACGVQTVAMESTGVYWIALFQILEAAGLEVCLVNARHCKNLPGRKTDIQDCQWLQYLHSVGLLRGSFRPPEHICAVRSMLRHRNRLVRCAADQVRLMHKALPQMNVQLQHVISDLVGVTGEAIVQALLAGERDPVQLAKLKDYRIKASHDTIARSLRGGGLAPASRLMPSSGYRNCLILCPRAESWTNCCSRRRRVSSFLALITHQMAARRYDAA